MNILSISFTEPFDLLAGIFFLIINLIFCFKLSTKYDFGFKNCYINFILYNFFYYFIIIIFLLFCSIFYFNFNFLRNFFYLFFFIQILFIFFDYKDYFFKFKNQKNFFKENFQVIIIVILIFLLLCSPTSDADSLDYHLGGPLEIIRNGSLVPRNDQWLSHRLIMSGEMINLYGLIIGSKNFGQLFQILPIILIIFCFKNIIKNYSYRLNINLFLFSNPILLSLSFSQKHLLIPSAIFIFVFHIFLTEKKYILKNLKFLLFLIFLPITFKYSYLIYCLPIYIFLIFQIVNFNNFKKILFNSLICSFIIILPFYLKNLIFYGDPVSPFLEFLKSNPSASVLHFVEELRFSKKLLSVHELFYLPLIHIIPTKVENLSLLVSPLAISFYLLIISFKNLKDIRSYIFLITTIYVLLFFAGKSPSRFFIDIYFLSTYLLIYKIKYFIDKSYFKYIYKFSVIYFLFFITALIYSIVSFTPGSFSSAQYSKYMNKNAFLYSESEWINQNINIDSKIIYDRDIMRIKILQKNIFYYYDFSFYKEENIKDIIQNNYNYIVISEKNFKKYLKNNFYCDQSLIKKKNSYVKTRNPLNKKPFELIYLFKLECLEF